MISVVTPALRPDPGLLRAAGASLAAQEDAPPFEWVVLAQDDPKDVAGKVVADCSFPVRLFRHRDALGQALARNIASLASSAEWVCPLDADDELPPSALATLYRAASRSMATGYVVGAGDTFGAATSTRTWHLPLAPGAVRVGALAEITRSSGYLPSIPVAGLYRRALLERVGGWPALPRDEDTYVKLATSSLSPGWAVDEVVYRYRRDVAGQITASEHFESLQVPSRRALVRLHASVVHGGAAPVDEQGWRRFIHNLPR